MKTKNTATELTRPHGITVRELRALLDTANPSAIVWIAADNLCKARHAALDAFNPGSVPVVILQGAPSKKESTHES